MVLDPLRAREIGSCWLRGVFRIHDGGPSLTAAATRADLERCRGWWRPRSTPAQASWLNQAELLNHAFDDHFLRRGSWVSLEELIAQVASSWPEGNRRSCPSAVSTDLLSDPVG